MARCCRYETVTCEVKRLLNLSNFTAAELYNDFLFASVILIMTVNSNK